MHSFTYRTFTTFDIIRRVVERYSNFKVNLAMGVTDIDDKIIAKCQGIHDFGRVARHYEQRFIADLKRMNIKLPGRFIRVTDNVDAIIEMISGLVQKKYAYAKQDGVYFDINAYMNGGFIYPKFRRSQEIQDFCLWKRAKEGEPYWPSPWGVGRPGWHIECSSFVKLAFKERIDLHSGGIDLCFPHHENEIAQSEAFHGKTPWCPFFIHTGHVQIDGIKMSKSLGNTTSLQDLDPNVLRMFCLVNHYRANCDSNMEKAQEMHDWLRGLRLNLSLHGRNREYADAFGLDDANDISRLERLRSTIKDLLSQDMNTPAVLHHVRQFGPPPSHPLILDQYRLFVEELCSTFGLGLCQLHQNNSNDMWIDQLIQMRDRIRKIATSEPLVRHRLFELSDAIRDQCQKNGVEVADGLLYSTWRYR